MSRSPLSEVQQGAADDVLDAAEHFLRTLESNTDGKSVRAAFYGSFIECLDAYAETRRGDA